MSFLKLTMAHTTLNQDDWIHLKHYQNNKISDIFQKKKLTFFYPYLISSKPTLLLGIDMCVSLNLQRFQILKPNFEYYDLKTDVV